MPSLTRVDSAWVLDLSGSEENRFSHDWLDAVEGYLARVADDPEALPLITSGGQDKFFSNGLDLLWMLAHRDEVLDYLARAELLLSRMLTLPVPTVAAINGHAFGAGAMLALCHDQRVMRADRGYFCLPEIDLNLGFSPGMTALLVATLPPQTARVAMTTGRRYGGEEALRAGIVHETGPLTELPVMAARRVERLAGKKTAVMGRIKQMLFSEVVGLLGQVQPDGSLDEALGQRAE